MAALATLPAQAYVYVIGAADGPQKIGAATDPEARRTMLQVGNPLGLTISHAHPVPRALVFRIERRAHLLLSDRRVRGDWFDVDPAEALAAIQQASADVESGDMPGRQATAALKDAPWQRRAKQAGLSQKELARLLGVHENTVSLQLRGKWENGTPRYVKTIIRMWERLPQASREAILIEAAE